MIQLVKGQRVKFTDIMSELNFQVRLEVAGLKNPADFFCLVLNATGNLVADSYFLHPRQTGTPCRAIELKATSGSQATYAINLALLPREAQKVVFGFSLGDKPGMAVQNASHIQQSSFTLEQQGHALGRYMFSAQDFTDEKALVIVEFYRKDIWRLAVISSGFRQGRAKLLQNYGIVEATPPDPAVAEPPLVLPHASRLQLRLPTTWPGNREPVLPQDLLSAVGLVVVENRDGSQAVGTGFVISPGGYILSCYHVVSNAQAISICMENTEILRPLVLVAGDEQHDIALLWMTDGSGCPSWMVMASAQESPALGDSLGLLGYPLTSDLGISINYSQGIVNSRRQRGMTPLLQIDAGAAPGSSGGPVFGRSHGRIVGILQSGIPREGIIINLALDTRIFWELGWATR